MNTNSLVSIIVPCYNQAQYLEECLLSVLNQSYDNWECLIVNDGSSDNTSDIAKSWCLKDSRFIYLEKNNGGLSSARNYGIKNAKGNWILPLDADDYISINYLNLASVYFKNENIKLIYCKAKKFGIDQGEWILPEFSLEQLAIQNIIFCTAFFRRKDWEMIGGYDENLKLGCEDWDFWISLLKNYDVKNIIRIEEFCFFYRTKDYSMVKSITDSRQNQIYNYIEKKHFDFFIKYLGNIHSIYNAKVRLEDQYARLCNSKRYKIMNFVSNILKK